MISINNALSKIINEVPFLEDGLYNEYINLSSFATYIKPQIESILKKEITIGAIKMALSRYVKEKKTSIKYRRFNIENIFIKKNINIIYLKSKFEKLSGINDINLKDDDYLTIIQGNKNATIIYNESVKENIEKVISSKNIEIKIENLSLIGIFLDKSYINEMGIIYTLTKKINFSNINIVEIISNYAEISIIVKNEDLKKAVETLII